MNYIDIHSVAWSRLQAQRERLPHALLLIGQRGLGKLALAQTFAKALLCEQPEKGGLPCEHCLACNWFEQGNHPDFRLLQPPALAEEVDVEEGRKKASQQITIDQVRALDDFLNVGTHRAGLKVIIVNPTEAMNRNAANALLKTLEEPSPGTLFLMVSNEPLRLLPTIRSRCQTIPVSVPPAAIAEAALAADGLEQAGRWLALAGGSPRLAGELAASGQKGWLDVLTRCLAANDGIDPIASAGELEKIIKDSKGQLALKTIVDAMQKWFVDLTLACNKQPVRYFLAQQATISGLADMIPPAQIVRAYRLLLIRRREAEQPLNARLFIEGLFMDYQSLLRY